MSMFIHLHAKSVHDNGNGTVTVELYSKPMPAETMKIVESHLPDLMDGFQVLLDKQALLSSIASIADVQDTVKKENGIKRNAPVPQPYKA